MNSNTAQQDRVPISTYTGSIVKVMGRVKHDVMVAQSFRVFL